MLIRVARIAVLLLLAYLTVILLIGLFGSTGPTEKIVLILLIAACLAASVGVSLAAARLREKTAHHTGLSSSQGGTSP